MIAHVTHLLLNSCSQRDSNSHDLLQSLGPEPSASANSAMTAFVIRTTLVFYYIMEESQG